MWYIEVLSLFHTHVNVCIPCTRTIKALLLNIVSVYFREWCNQGTMMFHQDSIYRTGYYISKYSFLECLIHIQQHNYVLSWVVLYTHLHGVCFFHHWLPLLIWRITYKQNILDMFVPCPFKIHVVCHSLYGTINEIGNGT